MCFETPTPFHNFNTRLRHPCLLLHAAVVDPSALSQTRIIIEGETLFDCGTNELLSLAAPLTL